MKTLRVVAALLLVVSVVTLSFKIVPKTSEVFSLISRQIASDKKTKQYNSAFKVYKYKHVTLYYHPDLEPALKVISAYIDQAESEASKLFPNITNKPLILKFDYDEEVFRTLQPSLINSQGFYLRDKNTIHILVKDCNEDVLAVSSRSAVFKDTVLHEYCHYKLKEFVESNDLKFSEIPAWVNEGIASYVGLEGARDAYQPKAILPFEQLADPIEWTKHSNETKGEVYVQAHYAVSQLIMSKGEKIIGELLLNTKQLSFEEAFKKTMGFSLDEYRKQLEEDMKRGWRKYKAMISKQSKD